jgi:hypothetical protein
MRTLGAFADGFCRTLRTSRPRKLITVMLPTAEDYRPMAPKERALGYYSPAKRMLVSVDRGTTLVHEFTHALHHADCQAVGQEHAIWVKEGLATLFETSVVTPTGIRGRVNLRLITLQRAIRTDEVIPLERFVGLSRGAFDRQADVCYAQAKYLMLYLQEQGKLASWYAAYKKGYAKDKSGRSALTETLGRPLFRLDDEWREWVANLALPWGQVNADHGRLGLQLRDTRDGVKIVGFDPASPAEKAGRLKKGDVVVKFGDVDIQSSAGLVGAIRASQPMSTVKVAVRRRGRTLEVLQPIGQPHSAGIPPS